MTDRFLTATLYAPIASFGGIAVGERRGTEPRPTRSALLGLLAAALGIERANADEQRALSDSYGVASMVLGRGRPLTDYHTAQVPSQRRNRRFVTRRRELGVDDLNTVLSSREYRTDAIYAFAVWERDAAPYRLERLADALRRPRFVLYLGRKSCPLALPLAPRVAAHDGVRAALLAHRSELISTLGKVPSLSMISRQVQASVGEIALDLDDAAGEDVAQIIAMRDRPLSRDRWQFGLRSVAILRSDDQ